MIIGIDGRSLDTERTGIARYLENLLREWSLAPRNHHFRLLTMQNLCHSTELYLSPAYPQSQDSCHSTELYLSPTYPHARPIEHRIVSFEVPHQADLFSAELARAPVDAFFSPLYELPDAVQVPAVITIHDLVHEATPEAFNAIQLDYLRQRHDNVISRASAILTDSRFAHDEIVARFPHARPRLSVIPLAADPRFRPRQTPTPSKRPYILYVGAISAKRHIPQLLQAFQTARGLDDVELQLVGRNYLPHPADLDAAIAGTPRVHHRPYVDNDTLLSLYQDALAFVYLSTYEGFGMPPLEAMACGTPVIVADAASLPEVVGDAAVRVRDPRDVDEIRRALQTLADPERRHYLSRRGLAQAARFSWSRTAALTLDVIERVAQRQTRSGAPQ